MRVAAVIAAACLALAGCSMFGDDDEPAAAGGEVAPAQLHVPVDAVRHIEFGRTRDGIVITAIGVAPGLGYSMPELRARREGRPGPDGYLDFDFVARQPDPGLALGEGTVQARTVRADLHLKISELQGARGLRVHGISGGLQADF